MRNYLQIRSLSISERTTLRVGLRSRDSFVVRRSQVLLGSERGEAPSQLGLRIGYSGQQVRNIIRSFNAQGLGCLARKSTRPKSSKPIFGERRLWLLKELLHQSPRGYGKPRSRWTLELVAEVCYEQSVTSWRVSDETIRDAIHRLGYSWKRAKRWITSPDPAYQRKKHARDRLIRLGLAHPEWVLGFLDEVWWSRLTFPVGYSWEMGNPAHQEHLSFPKDDPAPKALACYGTWFPQSKNLWLRFVKGRPVSAVTIEYLAWMVALLDQSPKKALLLIWDNASWHKSQAVATWIRTHNQTVKQTGKGVRIIACRLPVKSPWLNPIEPKWLHGKRAIAEPDRILSSDEIQQRVHHYYETPRFNPLIQTKTK